MSPLLSFIKLPFKADPKLNDPFRYTLEPLSTLTFDEIWEITVIFWQILAEGVRMCAQTLLQVIIKLFLYIRQCTDARFLPVTSFSELALRDRVDLSLRPQGRMKHRVMSHNDQASLWSAKIHGFATAGLLLPVSQLLRRPDLAWYKVPPRGSNSPNPRYSKCLSDQSCHSVLVDCLAPPYKILSRKSN